MKKILVLILALTICLSFVACGGDDTNEGVDISTLKGTWRGVEEATQDEYHLVFDGNGNLKVYLNENTIWGTYKYEYKEDYKKAFYWSTDEEGTFCPVEVVETEEGIQYKMINFVCEEVDGFVPSI